MDGTIELPKERVAEMVREQALLDSDVNNDVPTEIEDIPVDESWYDVLKDASVYKVGALDDGVRVYFDGETTIQTKERSATRWEPAEYATHTVRIGIDVMWSLDPSENPKLFCEVMNIEW